MSGSRAAAACSRERAERRLVKLSIALTMSSMLVGADVDVILVNDSCLNCFWFLVGYQ